MFHHYINDVATYISICWYLSFWILWIELLVTVAIICVLIGTCGKAYTGVSWHSLFGRWQHGRDISFKIICINIISQVVHIYCIEIHICKYFCHHIWDIHMYFLYMITCLFHILIYTISGCWWQIWCRQESRKWWQQWYMLLDMQQTVCNKKRMSQSLSNM